MESVTFLKAYEIKWQRTVNKCGLRELNITAPNNELTTVTAMCEVASTLFGPLSKPYKLTTDLIVHNIIRPCSFLGHTDCKDFKFQVTKYGQVPSSICPLCKSP